MSTVADEFLNFVRPLNISVVADIGSRDAREGVLLFDGLNADALHVFEANPQMADVCRENIRRHPRNRQIHFEEAAVSDHLGTTDFYAVEQGYNVGASSIYPMDEKESGEDLPRTRISVNCVTLDHYFRNHHPPDLLWIDVQGAELKVLQGGVQTLKTVRAISVEVSFVAEYIGQGIFWDVDEFLKRHGFKLWKFVASSPTKSFLKTTLARCLRPKALRELYRRIQRIHPRFPIQGDAVYYSESPVRAPIPGRSSE